MCTSSSSTRRNSTSCPRLAIFLKKIECVYCTLRSSTRARIFPAAVARALHTTTRLRSHSEPRPGPKPRDAMFASPPSLRGAGAAHAPLAPLPARASSPFAPRGPGRRRSRSPPAASAARGDHDHHHHDGDDDGGPGDRPPAIRGALAAPQNFSNTRMGGGRETRNLEFPGRAPLARAARPGGQDLRLRLRPARLGRRPACWVAAARAGSGRGTGEPSHVHEACVRGGEVQTDAVGERRASVVVRPGSGAMADSLEFHGLCARPACSPCSPAWHKAARVEGDVEGQLEKDEATSEHHLLTRGKDEDKSKATFFSVLRYQQYFDVDTRDVVYRIREAVLYPHRGDFLDKVRLTGCTCRGMTAWRCCLYHSDSWISVSPDLYGPFWIATTLVFVTAAMGNYAVYLSFKSLYQYSIW
eukprot:scaffold4454_cov411-Prasinococcus_capsulatus_cf.AAC.8